MKLKRLEPIDMERWNAFVRDHPEGTFFHLAEWKTVLERAFRHRTYYLYAEIDGRIEGVLPLGHIKSRLFSNALISTPFCVYGGTIANDEGVARALETEACQLAERLSVDYLELRNRKRSHPDWPCSELYVYFAKELAADEKKNMLAIPRKQRAMVRKGIKAGLEGKLDGDIGRFYELFAESVHNLGTPVFSRRFFQTLWDVFGDACEVLTVEHEGKPVTSVMSFYFRDQVLPYYAGGTNEARAVAANDFKYWDLVRRVTARGIKVFDYGRSKKETGSYKFKKHWGFEPTQLYYEFYLVRANELPNINPLNPRYQRAIGLWRRLPLWATKLLGPPIARNLG